MLRDVTCRTARSRAKPYRLTDGHGLYLDVRPSSRKFWRLRYEVERGGQHVEQLFKLGEYVAKPSSVESVAISRQADGFLTLAEARAERDRVRGLVRQGLCPLQERKRSVATLRRESATTLTTVAEDWLTSRAWEEATRSRRRRMLERTVLVVLGDLPIKSITSQQLLDVLQSIAGRNGLSVAAEARRTVSSIYGYAIATLRAEIDPMRPIQRALPANKT